jgi:hypothetical protein
VARAKRTARAEARRRSRAAQGAEFAETDEPIETTGAPSAQRPAAPAGPAKAPPPGTRMPFTAAVRASVHPVHVREDLASLPWIALHTKALWVPVLITVASLVAIVATHGGDLSLLLFAYFIQTPAIGGVFIAGFLAPRASWLLGVVVGLVAAACYSILVIAFPSTIYAGVPPTPEQATQVAIGAFALSPVFGAFLAAGAAWYRRFLRLTAPSRASRPNEKVKRAGDGRTRTSGVQKAGVKR